MQDAIKIKCLCCSNTYNVPKKENQLILGQELYCNFCVECQIKGYNTGAYREFYKDTQEVKQERVSGQEVDYFLEL